MTCSRLMVFSGYSGFLHQQNWPPRYSWNVVLSCVKHHNSNPLPHLSRVAVYIIYLRSFKLLYICSTFTLILFRNTIDYRYSFIKMFSIGWFEFYMIDASYKLGSCVLLPSLYVCCNRSHFVHHGRHGNYLVLIGW